MLNCVDIGFLAEYNDTINSSDKEPVNCYKAPRESLVGEKGCADGF